VKASYDLPDEELSGANKEAEAPSVSDQLAANRIVTDHPAQEIAISNQPGEESASFDQPADKLVQPAEEQTSSDPLTEELAISDQSAYVLASSDKSADIEKLEGGDQQAEAPSLSGQLAADLVVTGHQPLVSVPGHPIQELTVDDNLSEETVFSDQPVEELTVSDHKTNELADAAEEISTFNLKAQDPATLGLEDVVTEESDEQKPSSKVTYDTIKPPEQV
jgi:hypothetical protein